MVTQIKMIENDYNFLQKQIYTIRELEDQLTLIEKNNKHICIKYNMPDWTDTTYDNLINILDYIYPDYINSCEYGYNIYYCVYSIIYNNIIIQITSNSDITHSSIIFRYIESQIDINDLNLIKKIFFLAF